MNGVRQVKDSWNAVYQTGSKYKGESPISFIKTIISALKGHDLLAGKGLYIGCGNGRNYIPLIEEGLDLTGLDISDVALQQIADRMPHLKVKLICSPLSEYQPSHNFDYIIAIQVFQHGNYDEVISNFQKVANLLKLGGLFFFRNRASDTLASEKYEVIEETPYGGFTVEYLTGSKKGLEIHFLSEGEINELPKIGLIPMISPYKVRTPRKLPESGDMVHWEGVWQKKDLG
ncbi:hypothetical protein A2957_01990 [Candidatus Roizmanbacteria bacterium RIFCSPLOWO2_01_FULL_38_11]|uniref:Methyltransferase type 12 domain-containing protein n=1 Tax=Candidatus Roizmanbacteria bacterium RIFCSPLOWO2_01_FULL_38_11 TaxID=1802060 RepID=A0A1F7IM48_9BACT|nr:MAG: hypothetical protein A2957_01990 [Candidatus Roizmanbacteria bacterium RIFCSPLOWO2_01_FULL_38_11]